MASACTAGLDTGFVALGYAKVGVLGVVQGITELLPISSTAHMRIVPALLGWRDPGSAFSAAMQLAALAAVVSYFWSDVRGLAVGSIEAVRRRDFQDWNFRFASWIILATIPILVVGALLAPILNACGKAGSGIMSSPGSSSRTAPSAGARLAVASRAASGHKARAGVSRGVRAIRGVLRSCRTSVGRRLSLSSLRVLPQTALTGQRKAGARRKWARLVGAGADCAFPRQTKARR